MKTTERTKTELAALCGTSRSSLETWRARPDWPGDSAPEATLKRYAAKRLEASRAAQTGPHGDLKARKLEKQIALLTHQARRCEQDADHSAFNYAKERAEYVTLREYRQTVCGVVELCKTLMEQFIFNVAAKRKDAGLMAELEAAKARALDTIRETYLPETEDQHIEDTSHDEQTPSPPPSRNARKPRPA